MNRWTFWTTLAVKWNIFIIESYISLMAATIVFHVFFKAEFSLSVFEIWLVFFLLTIPNIISNIESKWLFYLILAAVFILGWFFLQLSVYAWIFTLIFILWRIYNLEQFKGEIYDYVERIYFYLIMVLIYYLTNSFYHFPNNQTVYYSFVIVFFSFLLGGMLLQTFFFSKELLKSFAFLLSFTIIGVSLFFLIFTFFRNPIFYTIAKVKEGIEFILYWVGYWLNVLREFLLMNNKGSGNESFSDFNPKNPEELLPPLVQPYDMPLFIKIIGYLVAAIVIIGISLFVVRLIKGIIATRSEKIVRKEAIIQSLDKRERKKRIIPINIYRKLYQDFLLWLIRKKKIIYAKSDTLQVVTIKILAIYPDASQELDLITKAYQQVRYGKIQPDISQKDYRGLIRELKKEMRSLERNK